MNRYSKYILPGICLGLALLMAPIAQAADTNLEATANSALSCGVFADVVNQVTTSVAEGALAEADASRLLTPLLTVCSEKLPLGPFEDKLAEGLAKKVAPAMIERALNQKIAEYRYARTLMQENGLEASPQALVILGEGLSRGVPRQDFENFVSTYASQNSASFLTGMEMTSLLRQAGFDFQLVHSMLDAAYAAPAFSSQWRYFIRIVLVARQRNVSDASIATAAIAVLENGGIPNDVTARLGFTSRDLSGRNIAE